MSKTINLTNATVPCSDNDDQGFTLELGGDQSNILCLLQLEVIAEWQGALRSQNRLVVSVVRMHQIAAIREIGPGEAP